MFAKSKSLRNFECEKPGVSIFCKIKGAIHFKTQKPVRKAQGIIVKQFNFVSWKCITSTPDTIFKTAFYRWQKGHSNKCLKFRRDEISPEFIKSFELKEESLLVAMTCFCPLLFGTIEKSLPLYSDWDLKEDVMEFCGDQAGNAQAPAVRGGPGPALMHTAGCW